MHTQEQNSLHRSHSNAAQSRSKAVGCPDRLFFSEIASGAGAPLISARLMISLVSLSFRKTTTIRGRGQDFFSTAHLRKAKFTISHPPQCIDLHTPPKLKQTTYFTTPLIHHDFTPPHQTRDILYSLSFIYSGLCGACIKPRFHAPPGNCR